METRPLNTTQASSELDLSGHWYGGQGQVKSDPLIDMGVGDDKIVRFFQYQFDPEILKKIKDKKLKPPSKQELFNSVWPQIRIQLWGDGLVANTDIEPRMQIKKRQFIIGLVCEPRANAQGVKNVLVDKSHSLNDYLKNA